MRLIDAQKLRKLIPVDKYGHIDMTITNLGIAIQNSEVDAVPVVRCKDCIHLKVHGMEAECGAGLLGVVNASDYCSHAIRKERKK